MMSSARHEDIMRLGRLEFAAMNTPLRRMIQKHVEFATFCNFLKLKNISLTNTVIMDAGCGSGYSTQLIINEFKPVQVIAFDLMPEQIELAKKRGLPVNFTTGDVTNMREADNSCHAVFVFAVLHHIPKWRTAIQEIYRVLKPGGWLLVEEPEYRLTWKDLKQAMMDTGFAVLAEKNILFRLFRSYLCQKPEMR